MYIYVYTHTSYIYIYIHQCHAQNNSFRFVRSICRTTYIFVQFVKTRNKKEKGFYIYIICKPLYNKHDRWKFTDAKRKKENKRGKKKRK